MSHKIGHQEKAWYSNSSIKHHLVLKKEGSRLFSSMTNSTLAISTPFMRREASVKRPTIKRSECGGRSSSTFWWVLTTIDDEVVVSPLFSLQPFSLSASSLFSSPFPFLASLSDIRYRATVSVCTQLYIPTVRRPHLGSSVMMISIFDCTHHSFWN